MNTYRNTRLFQAERLARARRNRLKMPELKDLRQQLTSKAVEHGHLLLGFTGPKRGNQWAMGKNGGFTWVEYGQHMVLLWDDGNLCGFIWFYCGMMVVLPCFTLLHMQSFWFVGVEMG